MRSGSLKLLVAATAVAIVAAVFSFYAVLSETRYRAEVASSRSFIFSNDDTPARLAFRMEDTALDKTKTGILYIAPLTADAPVPPGIKRWLKPGESAVCPGALPFREQVEKQYGKIAAVIDDDSCLDGESYLYSYPKNSDAFKQAAAVKDNVFGAYGFDTEEREASPVGIQGYENWYQLFYVSVLLLLGIPLFAVVVATRRAVQKSMEATTAKLLYIGARRQQVFRYIAKRFFLPYCLAAGLSIIAIVLLVAIEATLPGMGFRFHRAAYSDTWLIPALCIPLITVLIFYIITFPSGNLIRKRKHRRVYFSDVVALAIFGSGILLVVVISLFVRNIPNELVLLATTCALALVLVGLPGLLSTAISLLGFLKTKTAENEFLRIDGQLLMRRSREITRTAAVAGVYICLGAVFINAFGVVAKIATDDKIPADVHDIVTVSARCWGDKACAQQFAAEIKHKFKQETILAGNLGSTPKILSNNLSDNDINPTLLYFYDITKQNLQNISVNDLTDEKLIIVGENPRDILNEVLNINQTSNVPITAFLFGDNNSSIQVLYEQQTRWLLLFIIMSFVIFAVVLAFNFETDALKFSIESAGIAAITGKVDLLSRELVKRNLIVNIIAGAISLLIGLYFMQQIAFLDFTYMGIFVAGVGVVYLLLIVYQMISVSAHMHTQARAWLPGKAE